MRFVDVVNELRRRRARPDGQQQRRDRSRQDGEEAAAGGGRAVQPLQRRLGSLHGHLLRVAHRRDGGALPQTDAIPGQSFVYFGDDYLTDVESLPVIPAPGQPSKWARVETAAAHPDYDANVNYPDFAILHLDRELPFDPIPLLRAPVTAADKKGEIAGWGGSKALTADISQVEGVGIKRSAKVKILGSPTEADFHPDDPNPGILDPAIRPNLLKTDGMAPSANTCAGDSGGPLLVERKGQTYLAGVGFWTGLFCEDYAIFSRIDPFLAFFDDAVTRAGKAPIVPRLECIEPQASGSFLAHFGYRNDNALTVTIPYGKLNLFDEGHGAGAAARLRARRQRVRLRGDVRRTEDQLSWKLTPPSAASTTVVASASSPVCDPADPTFVCAKACDAQFAAECADPHAQSPAVHRRLRVEHDVLQRLLRPAAPSGTRTSPASPRCRPRPRTGTARSPASRPAASPNCDAELNAAFACLYY